jgi:hypothetical protein
MWIQVSAVSTLRSLGRVCVAATVARGELTRASLLCCGLFVAEDPGIIAVRRALGDTWPGTAQGIAVDVLLGVTMTGYNFVASRYVVTVGEASSISAAMRRLEAMKVAALDAEPRRWRRTMMRILGRLNPFDAIKVASEGFARLVERLRTRARRRALARMAQLLGELGAVNVLGVPGAGLESVARGETVTSRASMRHAALFVASWFAGARLLGAILAALHRLPVIGDWIAQATNTFGWAFDRLTDVRSPIGAIAIAIVVVALVRFSRRVERLAASLG